MTVRASLVLGDVLTERRERVAVTATGEYPIAGVYGFGRGLLLRESVKGGDISASSLYRIRSGQIIYSRLKAFEGAFALVPPAGDGRFVSNEFPTFDVDEDKALPAFVELVLSRPAAWRQLTERIMGVGARRERLQVADFLEFEIELPPIEQQYAALQVVDAVDQTAHAGTTELHHLGRLLRSIQRSVDEREVETCELGELLADIQAGKSPQCEDRPPARGEWGVLKVSAIREGRFVPSEAKALPPSVRPFGHSEVSDGDVLISRANTSQLVGAACRVADTPRQLLLSDKTLRLVVDESALDPDYLVEVLALPSVRRQIEEAATGSSASMKNVSQDALRALSIPLPSFDEQRIVARELTAVRTAASRAAHEIETGRQLRSSLIEAIVSAEVEIST